MQLDNFGVDLNELKKPATERLFHAYVEDWELEALHHNDPVPMMKLQQKYKGLKLLDADNNNMELTIKGVVWRRKNRTLGILKAGWYLLLVDEAGEEEDWEINDINCAEIGSNTQAPGIEIVKKSEERIAMELERSLEEGAGSDTEA